MAYNVGTKAQTLSSVPVRASFNGIIPLRSWPVNTSCGGNRWEKYPRPRPFEDSLRRIIRAFLNSPESPCITGIGLSQLLHLANLFRNAVSFSIKSLVPGGNQRACAGSLVMMIRRALRSKHQEYLWIQASASVWNASLQGTLVSESVAASPRLHLGRFYNVEPADPLGTAQVHD